jgi:hypothetical protein
MHRVTAHSGQLQASALESRTSDVHRQSQHRPGPSPGLELYVNSRQSFRKRVQFDVCTDYNDVLQLPWVLGHI